MTFAERHSKSMFIAGLLLSTFALLISALALAQPANAAAPKFDWVTINYVAPADQMGSGPDCGGPKNYAGRTYINKYSTLIGGIDEYVLNLSYTKTLYVCRASFKVLR